jgi:tRNA threonylcarbamoyladenosine biosynthesis protein TsaB
MVIFAVDTSSKFLTAAIMRDDVVISEFMINCGEVRRHSEILVPQIELMFDTVDMKPTDVDVFAAGVGPGSFTGIRIGISVIKAMSQALGKPCVGVSTLECMANNVFSDDSLVCPLIDARRGNVYCGLFERKNGVLTSVTNEKFLPFNSLKAELEERFADRHLIFLGSGAEKFKSEILGNLPNVSFLPPNLNLISASSICEIVRQKIFRGEKVDDYGKLHPSYISLCQAEQKFNQKHNSAWFAG